MCVDDARQVKETVTAAVQACDWLDEKYCDGCDTGTEGNVADNEIAESQKFEKPQRFDFGIPAIPGTVINTVAVPETAMTSDWFRMSPPSGCGCCYAGDDSFAAILEQQSGE
jgi:hypothetical protein